MYCSSVGRRATRLVSICALLVAVTSGRARANDFYVATDGDDGHAGTIDAPFATVEQGETAASPGDTVYIRGGVYPSAGTTGRSASRLPRAARRASRSTTSPTPARADLRSVRAARRRQRVTGLDVHCNYIHLRGLEVRGVRQLMSATRGACASAAITT